MANSTKKEKKAFLGAQFVRIILTLVSIVLSTAVLALSAFTIVEIYNNTYENAPNFLIWIFFLVGLLSVVRLIQDRTKVNLIKCLVLLGFNIVLGIVVLFAKNNPFLFSLTAGLYCLSIVVGRVFNIIQNHSIRSIILNGLIILLAILLGIGLFTSPVDGAENIQNVILLECLFIAIVSFLEAMAIVFSQLKVKVLLKIVVSTFSLEVLFGLLTMMVCFSFIFVAIEDPVESGITSFPDALWYCFATVTTIGFGDMTAHTPVGRVLTVLLGLYGLIAVAVITSIIVNFYNETSGKNDEKQLEQIKKDEEKKK